FEIRLRLPDLFRGELSTAEQVETSTDSSQLDTVVSKLPSSFSNSSNVPIGTSQCREGKLHRSLLIDLSTDYTEVCVICGWLRSVVSTTRSRCEFVCADIDRPEYRTRRCSAHSQSGM